MLAKVLILVALSLIAHSTALNEGVSFTDFVGRTVSERTLVRPTDCNRKRASRNKSWPPTATQSKNISWTRPMATFWKFSESPVAPTARQPLARKSFFCNTDSWVHRWIGWRWARKKPFLICSPTQVSWNRQKSSENLVRRPLQIIILHTSQVTMFGLEMPEATHTRGSISISRLNTQNSGTSRGIKSVNSWKSFWSDFVRTLMEHASAKV